MVKQGAGINASITDADFEEIATLSNHRDLLSQSDSIVTVVIIGANDVINPAALDDPDSPIHGMPVLKVWESKHVIVLKRSRDPDYASIQHPMFFHDRARMLFGEAKASIQKLVSEVKTL